MELKLLHTADCAGATFCAAAAEVVVAEEPTSARMESSSKGNTMFRNEISELQQRMAI